MKCIYCSILFLLILPGCQQSKDNSSLVATVGSRKITVAEFKDRANFNPVIGKTSIQQHKEKILNSIVAEALLSQLDSVSYPDYIPLIIDQKHREAVIEKLWDDVIFKDLYVTDSSVWNYYLNTKKQRIIEFAVFTDSIHAAHFAWQWEQDNPAVMQVLATDTLSFTGNIAQLEKKVFNSTLNRIAGPLQLGQKYLVYKVLKEWQVAPASKQEYSERYKSIRKSYIKTLKHEYFIAYARKTFKTENYQLNKDLFKSLAKVLQGKILHQPELQEVNTDMLRFAADENDPDPAATLVRFDNGENWTVKTFLKRLAVSPYPLDYSSSGAFRYSLIKASRRMLDDELLYRKGLQYNLDKSNYVTWQTAMWRDFYKSKGIRVQNRLSGIKLNHILDSLQNQTEISVNWTVLDTLEIHTSDMIVLKTHFPGQTIVPRQNDWNFKIERD